MWEDILKDKIRMHEYNKVYDSLVDGKKRTAFEIAKMNDLGNSKVYHIMQKMTSSKARIFPGIKKERIEGIRARKSYLYWREVSIK